MNPDYEENSNEKHKLWSSILLPAYFIILIWLIKAVSILFNIDLAVLGLYPHKISGLIGIVTAPLIHSNWEHLLSNTLPLLLLGSGLLYFYKQSACKVFVYVYLIPGIFVWLFGRPAYHIGASGIIYGFLSFLFFSGIIRRDTRSIALSLIVTFLYGGLVWGVLPLEESISWEYHLFGALTGMVLAFTFRKSDPYKKYDWEDEPEDANSKKLEISYDNEYPFD